LCFSSDEVSSIDVIGSAGTVIFSVCKQKKANGKAGILNTLSEPSAVNTSLISILGRSAENFGGKNS
jgi:hypothetical protein